MKTYKNYQLYKTNPKLSGQIKWNLVVSNDNEGLSISNFQLLPISNNALSIIPLKSNVLNTTHVSNLRKYYNKNVSNFFKDNDFLDVNFKSNGPIVSNSYNLNLCPITYNMGCKRISFNKFNKQFEFFCPLWLEKVSDNIVFKFNVQIKNELNGSFKQISSKSLTLKLKESDAFVNNYRYDYSKTIHQNFLSYLGNYLVDNNIHTGNDRVANIVFNEDEKTAGIAEMTSYGVNLKKTLNYNKSNYTKLNVFNEVSTLLDTDKAILSTFENGSMICSQLFNFNLCFNLEDILSLSIMNMFRNQNVLFNISMDVFVDDILLDKYNFDTEFCFIDKTVCFDSTDKAIVDYVNEKKKLSPNKFNVFENSYNNIGDSTNNSTCHWSLIDDNNYIVNSFKGFEALTVAYNDKQQITEYYNFNQYRDTPTIQNVGDPLIGDFSTNWINTYTVRDMDKFVMFIKDTNKMKLKGTYIENNDNVFINNIKYLNISDDIKGKYVIGLIINDKLLQRALRYIDDYIVLYDNHVYAFIKDDLIMFLVNDIKYFTFHKILKYISNNQSLLVDNYQILKDFYNLLNTNMLPPKKVVYNDIADFCIRYDGFIRPRFTNETSTLYYKDIINIGEVINSTKSYIKELNDWSYNEIPTVIVNDSYVTPIVNDKYEYSWFNNSKYRNLYTEISFSKTLNIDEHNYCEFDNNYNGGIEYKFNLDSAIEDLITNKIKELYNLTDDNEIRYITNLYSSKFSWKFENNNIHQYDVNIVLKLR